MWPLSSTKTPFITYGPDRNDWVVVVHEPLANRYTVPSMLATTKSLSLLPCTSMGFAPLPSVGKLFTADSCPLFHFISPRSVATSALFWLGNHTETKFGAFKAGGGCVQVVPFHAASA